MTTLNFQGEKHELTTEDEPSDRLVMRCLNTGNPCGTDTVLLGHPCQCEPCKNTVVIRDFSLEKLFAARKIRTHCKNMTNDELLDEVIGLYNKYYLPEIEKLKAIHNRA